MRMPNINWTRIAESLAPSSTYGPVFMPDGSIYSDDGQMLVAPRGTAAMVQRHTRAQAAAVASRPGVRRGSLAGVA